MRFPEMTPIERLERLTPPAGPLDMVLDTDAFNEVDDQFAVVHALLSPGKLNVQALYAAPFHNSRSSGPADGMEKSYEELLRLLEFLGLPPAGRVFRGSTDYLPAAHEPLRSDAARDLVERALARPSDGPPLYVAAIGACTNVASAILLDPAIIRHIVVVWLGGHAFHWPNTREFNLKQDIPAARVLFDSGVPLVHLPCMGVVSHLHTTVAELNAFAQGRGPLGDYLAAIVAEHGRERTAATPACSKVIWDIATIAWLLNADWVPTHLVPSPIVTDQATWSFDPARHWIRSAWHVNRDRILSDFFAKLELHATCGRR